MRTYSNRWVVNSCVAVTDVFQQIVTPTSDIKALSPHANKSVDTTSELQYRVRQALFLEAKAAMDWKELMAYAPGISSAPAPWTRPLQKGFGSSVPFQRLHLPGTCGQFHQHRMI